MYQYEMGGAYGSEIARLEQCMRESVQRAAPLEALTRALASRPEGHRLALVQPNDLISNTHGYARAVQQSMDVLRGHRQRIPTGIALVLVIAVIAIFAALLLRLGGGRS